MREKARIDRIVEKIRKFWYLNPDWRLGQMIVNLSGRKFDIFYLEDSDLEKVLDEWLEEYEADRIR